MRARGHQYSVQLVVSIHWDSTERESARARARARARENTGGVIRPFRVVTDAEHHLSILGKTKTNAEWVRGHGSQSYVGGREESESLSDSDDADTAPSLVPPLSLPPTPLCFKALPGNADAKPSPRFLTIKTIDEGRGG